MNQVDVDAIDIYEVEEWLEKPMSIETPAVAVEVEKNETKEVASAADQAVRVEMMKEENPALFKVLTLFVCVIKLQELQY